MNKKLISTGFVLATMVLLSSCSNEKQKLYTQALDEYEAGQYEEALGVFNQIPNYNADVPELITECKYQMALKYFDEKNYTEALNYAKEVEEKRDVKDILKQCNFTKAVDMYNNSNYDGALEILNQMEQTEGVKEYRYKIGLAYLKNKNYDKAETVLKELGNYSDAKEKLSEMDLYEKYNNYVENAFDLSRDSVTIPYGQSEIRTIENQLKNSYITWYSLEGGENMEYQKLTRNGKKYGIYSAFSCYGGRGMSIVWYYLDDINTYYMDDIEWLGNEGYLSVYKVDNGNFSICESYSSLTPEQYMANQNYYEDDAEYYGEDDIEYDEETTVEKEEYSKEELFSVGAAFIDRAMQESLAAGELYVVDEYYDAGKNTMGLYAKFKIKLPERHTTRFLTIYLWEGMDGNLKYSSSSLS